MMWRDVYVKAAGAAEIMAALPESWKDAAGQPVLQGLDYALDVVGELVDQQGGTAWHLNVRLRDGVALPPALVAFELEVEQPKRQFA